MLRCSHCQNLHEYLSNLVEAISITPESESTLRNPQVILDAALTNAEDDPTASVEKVRLWRQHARDRAGVGGWGGDVCVRTGALRSRLAGSLAIYWADGLTRLVARLAALYHAVVPMPLRWRSKSSVRGYNT